MMFIFQMQYESDSTSSPSHFGVRNRKKNFSEDAEALSVIVDSVAAEMLSPQAVSKDKDVSDFVSTLTPGAQNAIRAASFAWGYENASKYVKNAMKLDEVKNADNAVEKSKAVIESMSTQAGQNEKTSEVSKFVWGYYNEDLKDTQASAGKTETMSEKQKTDVAQLEPESLRLATPSSSHDAAVNSICMGSINPALAYCASSYQDAETMQEQRVVEQKREELAKLIIVGGPHAVHSGGQKTADERQRDLITEAANLALSRREEEVQAMEKAEKQLNDAIKTLDKFSEDEKDAAKKIAQMLPRELASLLLADRRFSKKRALRAQLAKWAAFSLSGRKSLSAVPASNIIKLATLSTFLRRGK